LEYRRKPAYGYTDFLAEREDQMSRVEKFYHSPAEYVLELANSYYDKQLEITRGLCIDQDRRDRWIAELESGREKAPASIQQEIAERYRP
jgi:hypothetical protein